MINKKDPIISLPSQDRKITAETGQKILEALINSGILLRADCGGKGRCGKCAIRMLDTGKNGVSPPTENEIRALGETNIRSGARLACHTEVFGEIAIDIPETSLLSAEVAQKGPHMLPDPLPAVSIPAQFADAYGIAVDLGTTTIAVYLCDFAGRRVAGSTSMRNPQIIYGDDVMNRITAVHRKPGLLKQLQKMVVKAIEWGISYLSRAYRVDTKQMQKMVVVGNSTMIHLFAGEDPTSIGLYPYTPRFTAEKTFRADAIGFNFNASAEIITLPLISGFLGSDILAAAVAADLDAMEKGTVLVDVGTNGEVMLRTGSGFSATSCATGPAFEGASIHFGMHAVSGAIDAVKIDAKTGKALCSIIQKDPQHPKKPSGICGSGVISIVAELYRKGIVHHSGRFNPESFPAFFQTDNSNTMAYILLQGDNTLSGQPITFTQKDIRAIQLAKGALAAGIMLLCRESGFESPKQILVAGAFGSHIHVDDALSIGMFSGIAPSNVLTVGNAAGAGAILALFDDDYRGRALSLIQATTVFDLASHPNFQETFLNALSFPQQKTRC